MLTKPLPPEVVYGTVEVDKYLLYRLLGFSPRKVVASLYNLVFSRMLAKKVGRNCMANEEHLAILRQDVEVWNQWRNENPDIQLNFRDVDLSRAVLRGANLSGVDLESANLKLAHLSEANLSGAKLHSANFQRAFLIGTNLSQAILHEANLKSALLWNAKLNGADLNGADL